MFFVNWISLFFFLSHIVLTCYVYCYCMWLDFNTLFSCFFAGFLLFSPKGSVTGCDSSLGSFCYSLVTSFRVHASSFRLLLLRLCGNRCAEALVIYRNSLMGLLLSKEVMQLKTIIIIDPLIAFMLHEIILFIRNHF